jgi:succinate dehydrogenase / fumarate reductase, cytochrome b subunit
MAESTSATPAEAPKRPRRYKPWFNLSLSNLPLPGLVSIFHRASGAGLFFCLFILLYVLDRSLASPEGYAQAKAFLGHGFVKLIMLGLLWAYLHHFCAGIRYLFLDFHKGIDLPTARATSIAVFVVSLVLTVVLGGIFIW